MNRDDVKITTKETVYQGYASVEYYTLRHRLFEGGWSPTFGRELLVRYNAVAVLPYDPITDKVILIEQFRIGALKDDCSPWQLEVVAGVIDKDKTKEEIAHMELKEEAGLETDNLIRVHQYWTSPGCLSENVTLYCAIVDSNQADGIHGVDSENEDIKVHVMESSKAFEIVKSGRINNAFTIIALQWLELNKDTLVE